MAAVATFLAIPEYSARSLGRSGALTVVRIGRRVRVDPADLRAFIERQKRGLHPTETGPLRPGLSSRR